LLHIRARGDGAEEAVGALVDLVQRNFDEDRDHARSA
ncbi:HPr family phosphocarrier protein, partial [Mesorhizobium sp. USDA-HM6]